MTKPTSDMPTPLGDDIRLRTYNDSVLSYIFKENECHGYFEYLPHPDSRLVARRLIPSVFDMVCCSATEAIEHIMGG